ncbi:MAG: transcription antitermination factor NusB [Dehalococcoidia bacterium]|nr:transcription antitermination factor NusB [Dehalococcoidia bacterium]
MTSTHGSRRRSRIVAFQTLFEADTAGRDPRETMQRHLREAHLSEEAAEFTAHLVEGVERHRAAIDDVIRERAPAFPLSEMPPVDRNILRLAIYEVLFDNQPAPLRTAINEAVELAKGYGSESSGRFVNGVLGAVALAASSGDDTDTQDEA